MHQVWERENLAAVDREGQLRDQVVSTMSIEQMYNVMGQLKTICAQSREQARELFNTYPQLSMAVLRMHDLLSKYSSGGGPPPPVGIHSEPLPRGGIAGLSGSGMAPPQQLGGTRLAVF
eukprot:768726-Hanusia_phi.AAC.7